MALRETSPAKAGDFFEFFAEIDVLCALSTCPGGDLSKFSWGDSVGDADMVSCCRPLGVEVYEMIGGEILKDWAPPECPNYRGMHGIKLPENEQ
jgi:uncharacterized protein YcgI (DUF1989 family)